MSKFKPMWEIKQAAQTDALDIYIYGDIESDYYDWWAGRTIESETSANRFRDELNKHPNAKEINIREWERNFMKTIPLQHLCMICVIPFVRGLADNVLMVQRKN